MSQHINIMWQHWVNLIVGLWIILSAYINFGPAASATNLTIAGIIIAALALWEGLDYRHHEQVEHSHA